MLGRSLLPEREMRNKSGASSRGNWRHFYKALFFLFPLREKQIVVSSPTPFLLTLFGFLHFE